MSCGPFIVGVSVAEERSVVGARNRLRSRKPDLRLRLRGNSTGGGDRECEQDKAPKHRDDS